MISHSFAILLTVLALWSAPVSLFADERIYLTKDQALKLVCGDSVPLYDPKDVAPEFLEKLDDLGLARSEMPKAHFFRCEINGQITGYALIDNEIGKHLPITYVVGIAPDGVVTRVEMMIFREVIGWEARERRFMEQFDGSSNSTLDRLAIGKGIQSESGATLSSMAIAKGVKRALLLWKHFYFKGS